MDRVAWFETFRDTDPTYLRRGVEDGPWPAYFAYATASRLLENAQYVGAISDGLAQVQLFAIEGKPLIVAWRISGAGAYTVDTGAPIVTVTDWQGSAHTAVTQNGRLTLKLG